MIAIAQEREQQVITKNPRVVFYIPDELKKKLEKLAENRHRSVSSMVLVLVEQAIKEAEDAGEDLTPQQKGTAKQ